MLCFSYPPDKAKISLANAIVSEFPLLKNNMKDCKGYVNNKKTIYANIQSDPGELPVLKLLMLLNEF